MLRFILRESIFKVISHTYPFKYIHLLNQFNIFIFKKTLSNYKINKFKCVFHKGSLTKKRIKTALLKQSLLLNYFY